MWNQICLRVHRVKLIEQTDRKKNLESQWDCLSLKAFNLWNACTVIESLARWHGFIVWFRNLNCTINDVTGAFFRRCGRKINTCTHCDYAVKVTFQNMFSTCGISGLQILAAKISTWSIIHLCSFLNHRRIDADTGSCSATASTFSKQKAESCSWRDKSEKHS